MNRDAIWKWLSAAPLPVVLSICLTTTGTLAGWVWVVAGEQATQKAAVAVAVEQAKDAKENIADTRDALGSIDAKIDRLIQAVADLQAADKARYKEKNR